MSLCLISGRLLPKLPYIGTEVPDTTVTQTYSNGTAITRQTLGGVYSPGAYDAGFGDTAPIVVAPPPAGTHPLYPYAP